MKRLLLIAYYFPPMGGGGVARPSKFVKYLARLGWSCSVITTNAENYWLQDSSRLKDIPSNAHVVRTGAITGIGILRKLFHRANDHRRDSRVMGRLRMLTAWFLIPDSFVGWIPFALIKGWKICRREKIDAIVATAPPNSSAVVGWLLARLTGLPLVTDFRDLWVDEIHFHAPTRAHHVLHRYLESKVVHRSSAVLFTNPRAAEFMQTKYGHEGKFFDIRMGYDPEDYREFECPAIPHSPIRMVYTGNLTLNRPIHGLLEAVFQLQKSGEMNPSQLEIALYGQRDDEKDRDAEQYRLPHFFLKDNVSHREALRLQAESDILLFMGYNTNEKIQMVTSGKVYEYLYWNQRFGKPILAISSPMDATDILKDLPNCRVVGMEDIDAIKGAIRDLVSVLRNGRPSCVDESNTHSIETSVACLSGILERVVCPTKT